MTAGLDDAALRTLIRSVLHEFVPANPSRAPAAARSADGFPTVTAPPQSETAPLLGAAPADRAPLNPVAPSADGDLVDLRDDADLHAFVQRLAGLLQDPQRRAEIVSGRRRFRLATATAGGSSLLQPHRVDKGAVTERHVRRAADAGVRLVLGPRAVMTPLARDRARALGVPVEKER